MTAAIEYRSPTREEGIAPALRTTFHAFAAEPRPYDLEHLPKVMPTDRIISALDDGKPIGTTASFPFEVTIPGGQLPMAGVTWVGVLPSHRRRGVMTGLMRRQLEDVYERREPLAGLWASESAIYGRFGYGIAAPSIWLRADCANFRFRGDPEPVGSVRLVDRDEARATFPAIREQVRETRPGMLTREDEAWDLFRLADEEFMREGRGPKFYALYERDGKAEAYALYRVKSNWDDGMPRGELFVLETHATTPIATREMWRFLFAVDLTTQVEAYHFDPSSPLPLMVLDPRRFKLTWGDGMWLRLVDVDAALRARTYATDDSLVVEVTDELLPWNAGRYRVGRNAAATDDDPDLRLDVADLASAYLGAFSFEHLAAALRVEELTDGAVTRASALFATPQAPWCPEIF